MTTACTLIAGARWLEFEGFLMALAINELLMYGIYLFLSVRVARRSENSVPMATLAR